MATTYRIERDDDVPVIGDDPTAIVSGPCPSVASALVMYRSASGSEHYTRCRADAHGGTPRPFGDYLEALPAEVMAAVSLTLADGQSREVQT